LHTNLAIRAWAANILFANLDSYQGSGHNYYIYHDLINNKFGWITWDVNEAFGNFQMGMSVSQLENISIFYIPSPSVNRTLENRMLLDSTYRNSYIWEVCNFVANDFDTTVLYPLIDSLAIAIRPFVYADPNKFYTNSQFETNINTNIIIGGNFNIPGLKSFILNRRTSVVSQLAANGCYMGVEEENNFADVNVYPNLFTELTTLTINSPLLTKGDGALVLYNVIRKEAIYFSIPKETNGLVKIIIPKNNLTSGIYFYRILSNKVPIASGKLIIK
jgi:hypothetical protein